MTPAVDSDGLSRAGPYAQQGVRQDFPHEVQDWVLPTDTTNSGSVSFAAETSFDLYTHSVFPPSSLFELSLPCIPLGFDNPPVPPHMVYTPTVSSSATTSSASSQLDSIDGSPDHSTGGMPISRLPSKACEHWGERFKDDEQLLRHCATKHGERQDTCKDPRCGDFSAGSARSLKRHLNTAPAHVTDATPRFWCRCGFSEYRRDHFRRHLLKKLPCNSNVRLYKCWCSRVFNDTPMEKVAFEKHYRLCGAKQRGRPRKDRARGEEREIE